MVVTFDLATHPKAFCTVPQLADYMGCHRRTLIRMIEEGALRATKVGHRWRVNTDSARQVFHVERSGMERAS